MAQLKFVCEGCGEREVVEVFGRYCKSCRLKFYAEHGLKVDSDGIIVKA